MKIISRGILLEDMPIRRTCQHCTTVFEFLAKEAERVSDQRDGDFFGIKCPVCSRQLYLNVKS